MPREGNGRSVDNLWAADPFKDPRFSGGGDGTPLTAEGYKIAADRRLAVGLCSAAGVPKRLQVEWARQQGMEALTATALVSGYNFPYAISVDSFSSQATTQDDLLRAVFYPRKSWERTMFAKALIRAGELFQDDPGFIYVEAKAYRLPILGLYGGTPPVESYLRVQAGDYSVYLCAAPAVYATLVQEWHVEGLR